MKAKSVLLEPWYAFRLELPAECVGRAITDIQRMQGDYDQMCIRDSSSAENGHEDSPYGTYGSWGSSYAGSWESGDVKETWLFSQLIDLADLASITVDGVTYPIK